MTETVRVTSYGLGFGRMPHELIDDERITDPTTVAVYAALTRFADYGTGECWPSLCTIGKRARCDERTVQRHIDRLVELGYVAKKRTGRANNYHLLDPRCLIRPDAGVRSDPTPASDKRDSLNERQEQEKEPETGGASPRLPRGAASLRFPPPSSAFPQKPESIAEEEELAIPETLPSGVRSVHDANLVLTGHGLTVAEAKATAEILRKHYLARVLDELQKLRGREDIDSPVLYTVAVLEKQHGKGRIGRRTDARPRKDEDYGGMPDLDEFIASLERGPACLSRGRASGNAAEGLGA